MIRPSARASAPVAPRGATSGEGHLVRQRTGVALVVVLWTVALIATVTAMASSASRSSGQLANNRRAIAIARAMSESGIVAATAIVNDSLSLTLDDSTRRDRMLANLEPTRNAGPFLQDTLGDGVFAVTFVDVSARLDVNNAGVDGMTTVLRTVTDEITASRLARAIDARVRGDVSATERASGPPGGSMEDALARANARADDQARTSRDSLGAALLGQSAPSRVRDPFESLDELLEIDGMSEQMLGALAPLLTVDGDGRINRRAAAPLVQRAATGSLVDRPVRLLCIARGWQRGHALTREIQAVYDVSDDGLRLVRWRESSR